MSIRREREKHRSRFVIELKETFTVDVPLVVHWDGQLMEDLTTKSYVDRLPVIFTGDGISHQRLRQEQAKPRQLQSKHVWTTGI